MNNYLKTLLDSFGEALKEEAAIVEYNAAREEYAHDTATAAALNEYNVQRQLLAEQEEKDDKDSLLIASIDKRVSELYNQIVSAESMKRLSDAEAALNELLNEINSSLMSYIMPNSGSCGGSCSSCGGCH